MGDKNRVDGDAGVIDRERNYRHEWRRDGRKEEAVTEEEEEERKIR